MAVVGDNANAGAQNGLGRGRLWWSVTMSSRKPEFLPPVTAHLPCLKLQMMSPVIVSRREQAPGLLSLLFYLNFECFRDTYSRISNPERTLAAVIHPQTYLALGLSSPRSLFRQHPTVIE